MAARPVRTHRDGAVLTVVIDRPQVRNAVDGATARALAATFRDFDADDTLSVAVLSGEGEHFCAGYDLSTLRRDTAAHEVTEGMLAPGGDAPLGVSRLVLGKPVIAAVEGYAVAGGLELALWCDMRVASETAVFGVFCRRFGVPLVDGGTVRLPRLIGHSRALDMILTGRGVGAAEALSWGLANRVAGAGAALEVAQTMAAELAALPQACLRSDRMSAIEQWSLSFDDAMRNETLHGAEVLRSAEPLHGAARFHDGAGRHGAPLDR
jgi:enoyl-CoA hydratase/carnithine racemase